MARLSSLIGLLVFLYVINPMRIVNITCDIGDENSNRLDVFFVQGPLYDDITYNIKA